MVPERGKGPRRCVDVTCAIEITGALASLAVKPVTVEAALVDREDDALALTARLAEITDRVQIGHDVRHLIRPKRRWCDLLGLHRAEHAGRLVPHGCREFREASLRLALDQVGRLLVATPADRMT